MNVGPIYLSCGANPHPPVTGGPGKATPSAAPDTGTPILLALAPTAAAVNLPALPNDILTCLGTSEIRVESPKVFIEYYDKKITRRVNKRDEDDENPSIQTLRISIQTEKLSGKRRANNVSKLGESYILTWLYARGIGISNKGLRDKINAPEPDVLSAALTMLEQERELLDNYGIERRYYWPAQLALILSSEIEDPVSAKQLGEILANTNGWKNETNPRKKENLALEQLYKQHLENKNYFSLFLGENFYRRAMYKKSLVTVTEKDNPNYKSYKDLLAEARKYIERLATEDTIPPNMTARKLKKGQSKFFSAKVLRMPKELRKNIAWANLWMGNILMQEAEQISEPGEKLNLLRKAEKFLKNTAPLDGVALLEARKVLADNLIQQAYLLKNLGKDYLPLFRKAFCHLNYILAWKTEFSNIIRGKGETPRWLSNIEASTKVAKAKLVMVLAGDIDQKPVRELLKPEMPSINWAALESGDKTRLLMAQRNLLKKSAETLELYIARKDRETYYEYKDGNRTEKVYYFNNQETMELRVSLAENLARQGFIAKELGEANYTALLQRAEGHLNAAIKENSPANTLTRTMANFWLAKILFFNASEKNTKQEILAGLIRAKEHIEKAIASGKLHDTLLSYARQTKGEILLLEEDLDNAETEFKAARDLFKQNYEAEVNLADLYAQQGKHGEALALYQEIIAKATPVQHPILTRARLGLAEAQMRVEDNYSKKNVQKFEELAAKIFKSEPAGSFLILRAVDGLIEAYSPNENQLPRIEFITSTLLNLGSKVPADMGTLADAIKALRNKLNPKGRMLIPARYQAKYYLKLAESLSNQKKFKDANDLLKSTLPPQLREKIIEVDIELKAEKRLLDAEIRMRSEKDAQPMFAPELYQFIKQARNPDLTSRFIMDLTEAYAYRNDFKKIISTADYYLNPSNPLETKAIFTKKGRHISLIKFELTLQKKKADALFWDKQYGASLNELNRLLGSKPDEGIKKIERDYPSLKGFLTLLKAQINVTQGDVYLATKKDVEAKKYYDEAIKYCDEAIKLIKSIDEKGDLPTRGKVALVEAWIGLGEIHRYGKKLKVKDPNAVLPFYNNAEAIATNHLAGNSEDRARLMARIKLAKAKVIEELEMNAPKAHASMREAAKELDQISLPPTELASEIDHSYNDLGARAGLSINTDYYGFIGANGAVESQFQLGVAVPVSRLSFLSKKLEKFDWLRIIANLQTDHGVNTTDVTGYLGGEANLPRGKVSAQVKTGTSGEGHEMVYFRRPAYKLNFAYGGEIFAISAALNIKSYDFHTDSKLNTYNLSSSVKLWKGLRLGGKWDYFTYWYLGKFNPRHQFGFGPSYEIKATDWLKFQAAVLALLYSNEQKNYFGPGQFDFTSQTSWKPGVEVNLGVEINLGRHFKIILGCARQQTAEYPINLCRGSLVWSH